MTQVEQAILAWCRATKGWHGERATMCMRERPNGCKVVVNNEKSAAPVIADGWSWEEVASKLADLGVRL